MAAVLTAEQETATQKFVASVNRLRSERGLGPLSWNTAAKFLMARKFDVNRALTLYEQHEATRIREGLVRFEPLVEPLRTELETAKFTVLPKRDASGAAIAVFTARLHYPDISSHQNTLQGVVYQLDVALEDTETQRSGLIFIYDMTDSKYANFDYDLSQKILTLLKGAYPARLKKVLIVTAPLWFKAPFKILRLFVREKLRDRVYTVSLPQLSLHLPLDSLPMELGGTLKVDHAAWLRFCYKSMTNRLNDLCDLTSVNQEQADGVQFQGQLPESNSSCSSVAGDDDQGEDQDEEDEEVVEEEIQQVPVPQRIELVNLTVKEISTSLPPLVAEVATLSEEVNVDGSASPPPPPSSASSGFSDDDSLHFDDGRGLTLEEFADHVRTKGRRGLYYEYSEIKSKGLEGTFNTARLKSNSAKNRYTDVLCYDHSRVVLNVEDDDPSSDYINANFVDGYKQKNAFISTQGPLPKTFGDFWRMVWEQQCVVVVMTTRCVERGRPKCGQYWPINEEEDAQYGNFEVANLSVEQQPDYTITMLHLTNLKTRETRSVAHLQFTSWPDYGVPHSAAAILEFLQRMREMQSSLVVALGETWVGHPLGPPIVVHCSAGIGRTGSLCTIDICLKRLEDVGTIDVQGTVEKIRSQRAHSIQMPDQYLFCHTAVLECAVAAGHLPPEALVSLDEGDSE